MSPTISAHFIHVDNGLFAKRHISHAPRVGDELRFAGETYFTVTQVVWVYDEPEQPFQRLNIGITELEDTTK